MKMLRTLNPYNSTATDNLYIVAVRAKVAGTPEPTADNEATRFQ